MRVYCTVTAPELLQTDKTCAPYSGLEMLTAGFGLEVHADNMSLQTQIHIPLSS